MVNEVLYLTRKALMDVATGVNANLTALEVLDGHKRPADVKAIYIPSDHAAAFVTDLPQQLPAIIVTVREQIDITGYVLLGGARDITVPVEVAYLSSNTGDKSAAFRQSEYAARAIMRSLQSFAGTNVAEAKRVNGITIRGFGEVTRDGFEDPATKSHVIAFSVPMQVRDNAPVAAP